MLATHRLPQQQTFTGTLLHTTRCWRKVVRLQSKCGVTSPCPLSLLVDWQMSRSEETARGSSPILSGSPRSATATCARGFPNPSSTPPAPCRGKVRRASRQYRAHRPHALRPDRDLEARIVPDQNTFLAAANEAELPAIDHPEIERASITWLKARGSAASISGCTIRTSSIPTPTG